MSFFTEGPCQYRTGFLFAHECGRLAGATCSKCGKRVCDMHLTALGEGLVCASCAEDDDGDEDSEGGSDSDVDSSDEDDPSYYYKDYGYYGPGSTWSRDGNDPHDFTEADGESLRHEEDASFEEDLGGS
ncbi:hypothetical protein JY651_42965 [Pyxidicoccus parkwayensis]|uniref:Uncharacterized protein n=1 Tax=Pyxidicoccus parkwayensis TaxID=2813578 RepID=A0ABX7NSH8_9BACT|nr:hypothetical protein [Pyxidicoccus parkwaysis]QSQ21842.1 hypothetical protein JY651_42965 [Pyxidicoccus parkwaysis]